MQGKQIKYTVRNIAEIFSSGYIVSHKPHIHAYPKKFPLIPSNATSATKKINPLFDVKFNLANESVPFFDIDPVEKSH